MKTLVVGGFKSDMPRGKWYRHISHKTSSNITLIGINKIIFITTQLSHSLENDVKRAAKKAKIKMEFLKDQEFRKKYKRGK